MVKRPKPLPEFDVKRPDNIRNRKKKEKMEGYNDLKPLHQPYKRHHNHEWLVDLNDVDDGHFDEDDYRGYGDG